MKRILFVDDEPKILDGLKDLLRKQRKQWDMVFALGGQEALAQLAQGRFDVVVSDMRMPGVDGVTLLKIVKEKYPAMARIILSGHAEREAVVNALPVAHQFLTKPCDTDVLRTVVDRACGLQALLQDDNVRTIIGSVDHLPSVPRTYWELTQATAQADVCLADLAALIERDAAMTAKILQLVNSSYFGLAQRQTSVHKAVAYLGIELLKALALTAHVFSSATGPVVEGFSLEGLQDHSMQTARLAKRFVTDQKSAADAFTAAVVHDIGKIVLAMSVPRRFEEVIRKTRETGRMDHDIEKELLGVTHAEVGAYLLGLWGLPLTIVETVAYHHRPELVGPTHISVAVHVANALSYPSGPSPDPTAGGRLNTTFVEGSPFGSRLSEWRTIAEDELRALGRES